MRVLEFPEKNWSWLQWPVTVKTYAEPNPIQLHVTAKFFGDANIDRLAIIGRIPLQRTMWFAGEFLWTPTIFARGHVLELVKYPAELLEIHQRFDIIEDQFKPWRPHISVPREYWIKVDSQGLTPEMEELTFGEIELCLGRVNKTQQSCKGAKNANHN